jgi:hypothetical protein
MCRISHTLSKQKAFNGRQPEAGKRPATQGDLKADAMFQIQKANYLPTGPGTLEMDNILPVEASTIAFIKVSSQV